MHKNWILFVFLSFMLGACTVSLPTAMLGSARSKSFVNERGTIEVPYERTFEWSSRSPFADSVIHNWASMPMADWETDGKTTAPRIILARLMEKKDIESTNILIQSLSPRGVTGSQWLLNPQGDYDFTLTTLTTILYLFGEQPEVLYPASRDHLVNVLLTESGGKFREHVPRTLGMVIDTENHLLMTEGSRYLKNRWINVHGDSSEVYDNVQNGMEQRLHGFLTGLKTMGLYEFNSLPYIGYTIAALLNLEAFGSAQIRTDAREVLDYMNWSYALGSLALNHFPAMRRRYEKAGIREFSSNYQTAFMTTWLHFLKDSVALPTRELTAAHTLVASCMPYRPADEVVKFQFDKGAGYFVQFGHGPGATPEIYTAGKNYLLSSGGANRGKSSHVVPRPICLFLKDGADDLSQVIHLYGPSMDYMKWNNTGVYENLAVSAGPVHVPLDMKPLATQDLWSVYALQDSVVVVVYSSTHFGLMLVAENVDVNNFFQTVLSLNPSENHIRNAFVCPNGKSMEYDVKAPHRFWVMKAVDGVKLNRNVDEWPLMNGRFY